jgi:hypothetical protein
MLATSVPDRVFLPEARGSAPLDIVVPFTTPRLTKQALQSAARLGAGLASAVRLVRVQIVPFPRDPHSSPVPQEFLEEQMRYLCDALPLPYSGEIRLAREFEDGLRGALKLRSVIVIAVSHRPWRTRNERLADSLRQAGYTVVLVREDA